MGQQLQALSAPCMRCPSRPASAVGVGDKGGGEGGAGRRVSMKSGKVTWGPGAKCDVGRGGPREGPVGGAEAARHWPVTVPAGQVPPFDPCFVPILPGGARCEGKARAESGSRGQVQEAVPTHPHRQERGRAPGRPQRGQGAGGDPRVYEERRGYWTPWVERGAASWGRGEEEARRVGRSRVPWNGRGVKEDKESERTKQGSNGTRRTRDPFWLLLNKSPIFPFPLEKQNQLWVNS